MGIADEIKRLKREKNAVILAHYYSHSDVQDIADFVGDSLELSRKAMTLESNLIVMCGVYFMAETAKLLNPRKKVLIPYYKAGCLMADMAIVEEVNRFKERHPDYKIISYVNTSADVKAVSDVCCTSANAVSVTSNLDSDRILFLPDRNLGDYVSKRVKNKDIKLWSGYCPIHQKLTLENLENLKFKYPRALIVVHPECNEDVREVADFIGSTSQIKKFIINEKPREVIVGTEIGIIHDLRKAMPDVKYIPAYSGFVCDQMKMITLERVLMSLKEDVYEVKLPERVSENARTAIENMFKVGK